MLRKTIGILLLVVSAFLFLVLLMSGMLIFPHVIGPITLAVVGLILVMYRIRPTEPRTR